jgi:hypothetical protein
MAPVAAMADRQVANIETHFMLVVQFFLRKKTCGRRRAMQ